MVTNLEAGVKFFMFPRFVQVLVNHQLGDMSNHKQIFVTSSLTKKKKQTSRRKQRKETEVHDLEKAKTAQAKEIAYLKKRVKKLDRKNKSKTLGLQRLWKIGSTTRLESSEDKERRMNEEEKFRVNDLDGDEVIVDATASEEVDQITTVEDVKVTTAATTPQISKDKLTLAQNLIEIKAAELKKDQIVFDEEVARKLEAKMKAEMEEEESIARMKDEANMDSLKKKSFDEIQKLFDSVMKRINIFVDMNTEIVEERSKKTQVEVTEGSSKRAGDEIEQESAKRQKLEKENDSAKLKRCLEIVHKDDVSAAGIQGYYCLQQKLMLPSSRGTIVDRVTTAGWIKTEMA
uniref:Uncharacterized protein n=1 Tax=Tanacetum cinerariifolium TaxID=118510 RepID=A0A699J2J1_TANCI|nr:hypothetical protein [Tanacetum cinerariifolium]